MKITEHGLNLHANAFVRRLSSILEVKVVVLCLIVAPTCFFFQVAVYFDKDKSFKQFSDI